MRVLRNRTSIVWSDSDGADKMAHICDLFIIRLAPYASLDKDAQIHPSIAVFRIFGAIDSPQVRFSLDSLCFFVSF